MSLLDRFGERFGRRSEKDDSALQIFEKPQSLSEVAPPPETEAETTPAAVYPTRALEYRSRKFPERRFDPEATSVTGLENARKKGRIFFREAWNRIKT